MLGSTNADLRPFFARGGKLLMYHGWSDPQVTPYNTINFFHKVLATQGGAGVGSSIQLYMVPGMNHCQGGPGTDSFDKVRAIEDWIKTGSAPSRIEAAHLTNGAIDQNARCVRGAGREVEWHWQHRRRRELRVRGVDGRRHSITAATQRRGGGRRLLHGGRSYVPSPLLFLLPPAR